MDIEPCFFAFFCSDTSRRIRDKGLFIAWCPDQCTQIQKVQHSAMVESVKRFFPNFQPIEVGDLEVLSDYSNILEKYVMR